MEKSFVKYIRKAVSIAMSMLAILSVFIPCVTIGLKSDFRGLIGVNKVVEMVDGNGISSIAEEVIDLAEYYIGDSMNASKAKRQLRIVSNAMNRCVNRLRDSKLSLFEAAGMFTDLARVFFMLSQTGAKSELTNTSWVYAGAIICWIMVLFVVGPCVGYALNSIKGIYGDERPRFVLCAFMQVVLLAIIVFANHSVSKTLEETPFVGFILGEAGVTNYSILHINWVQYFLLALLAADIYIQDKYEAMSLDERTYSIHFPNIHIPSTMTAESFSTLTEKVFWTCEECGTKNANRSSFCSHCGKKHMSDRLCASCGAKIAKNSRFCAKCGSPIKEKTVAEKVVKEIEEKETAVKKSARVYEEHPKDHLGTIPGRKAEGASTFHPIKSKKTSETHSRLKPMGDIDDMDDIFSDLNNDIPNESSPRIKKHGIND